MQTPVPEGTWEVTWLLSGVRGPRERDRDPGRLLGIRPNVRGAPNRSSVLAQLGVLRWKKNQFHWARVKNF